jgi:hypothetical protein
MSNVIAFLTARETAAFIRRDEDAYVRGFSRVDLRARRSPTTDHYIARASSAAVDFDEATKTLLTGLCSQVDAQLLGCQRLRDAARAHHVCPDALAAIPWVLALTEGDSYEGGLPHTRKNVVFLSTGDLLPHNNNNNNNNNGTDNKTLTLARTLLHEKVHVYQRRYRISFVKGLLSSGYMQQGVPRRSLYMSRANPDLDESVYVSPKGEMYAALYRSEHPRSISDVVYTSRTGIEHPNELVAYAIAAVYST